MFSIYIFLKITVYIVYILYACNVFSTRNIKPLYYKEYHLRKLCASWTSNLRSPKLFFNLVHPWSNGLMNYFWHVEQSNTSLYIYVRYRQHILWSFGCLGTGWVSLCVMSTKWRHHMFYVRCQHRILWFSECRVVFGHGLPCLVLQYADLVCKLMVESFEWFGLEFWADLDFKT